MTQMHHVYPKPVFTPLPLGNPPVPTDRLDQEIHIGSPIAYAVSDGYLSVGIVRDIIHKVVDQYDWQTKQKIPTWATRLKVEVERDTTYSGSKRHVNLTKMGNIIVLGMSTGANLYDSIEKSWVDEP